LQPVEKTQTDEQLYRLVQGLNSLVDGEQVAEQLIACGTSAIAPLREFLLLGRPASVFQPRCWAVKALAGIGAKDVLMEYLSAGGAPADAVTAFSEDVVKNAAARSLGAWRTEDVRQFLLGLAPKRVMAGVLDALCEFETDDAIPFFLRALEDGLAKEAGERGLSRLGPRAREELLLSALDHRLINEDYEVPSSTIRRRAALGLLADIGIEESDWHRLRALLNDRDPEVAIWAARLGALYSSPEENVSTVRGLLDILPSANWYLQSAAEDALVGCSAGASRLIDEAIQRRMSLGPAARAIDSTLMTLLRVQRRLSHGGHERQSQT
jgi:hypothetical protein